MHAASFLASFVLLSGSALAFGEDPVCRKPAQASSGVAATDDQPVFRCGTPPHPDGQHADQEQPPRVEIVFVLDTTGSMGGLISSAKDTIWSIATTVAQAQPSPEIRMGLVAYRDRGDAYVTQRTEMTDDLDSVYAELLGYEARGGGDAPESVNQAIFEAVERFDWTPGTGTLRIVYLVGDAPPKMDYQDDVKHPATCRLAREKGILINTIQCGSMGGTREVWQEIAQNAGGAFAAIPQDGGTTVITTPFDDEIASLDRELAGLMIDYGDPAMRRAQSSKREMAEAVSEAAAPAAAADRAVYNQSFGGRSNLYGRQELVSDIQSERVALGDIPTEHLPEKLRTLDESALMALISENQSRRDRISARLGELARQRADFRAQARGHRSGGASDAFDRRVVEILARQAADCGLRITHEE